jgi:hypothetical protein
MLPHTVYLYQKQPIVESSVKVKDLSYNIEMRRLTCDIQNDSTELTRIQSVRALGDHASGDLSGFPLLPGGSRHIEMDWTSSSPPTEIDFRFERFNMKRPVTAAVN